MTVELKDQRIMYMDTDSQNNEIRDLVIMVVKMIIKVKSLTEIKNLLTMEVSVQTTTEMRG